MDFFANRFFLTNKYSPYRKLDTPIKRYSQCCISAQHEIKFNIPQHHSLKISFVSSTKLNFFHSVTSQNELIVSRNIRF